MKVRTSNLMATQGRKSGLAMLVSKLASLLQRLEVATPAFAFAAANPCERREGSVSPSICSTRNGNPFGYQQDWIHASSGINSIRGWTPQVAGGIT